MIAFVVIVFVVLVFVMVVFEVVVFVVIGASSSSASDKKGFKLSNVMNMVLDRKSPFSIVWPWGVTSDRQTNKHTSRLIDLTGQDAGSM